MGVWLREKEKGTEHETEIWLNRKVGKVWVAFGLKKEYDQNILSEKYFFSKMLAFN